MSEWTATEDVPHGAWVGFGDDRRYLLADDAAGVTFPWFRTSSGWDHTLDLAAGTLWHVHEMSSRADWDDLVGHVKRIPVAGCGARGWCQYHSRREEPRR